MLTMMASSTTSGTMMYVIMLVLMFAFIYFIMIRPQKKREKKEAIMRKNIQIGDEIVTAGGIVGIVFSIKEDTVVLETGGDRSKIRIQKWAIAKNLTQHEND